MKNITRKVCSFVCVILCLALLLLGAGCGSNGVSTELAVIFAGSDFFISAGSSC